MSETVARETIKARKDREQRQARNLLWELFPVGSTVSVSLAHVSASGMTRGIKVLHGAADGSVADVSWIVARVLGERLHDKGGVKVSGCGMDMGFHLVYSLARTLYRDAFYCTGERSCPANNHVNDRGAERESGYRTDRLHSDAGYALRHRWI